tara:strand:+ start:4922 stop:5692 length:771 start_codon:yes stop_codon:yes gene_type:complete
MNKLKTTTAAIALSAITGMSAQAGDWTANAGFSNNYLWRGLTQTTNDPVISGGIDYAHDSGFYIGTWVANVKYDNGVGANSSGDAFSYEHDIYLGYAGEYNNVSYDFGWLYYNYDEQADFDFSEIYGSLGYMGFTVGAYLLVHTEADEEQGIANGIGRDYDSDFGSTYYVYGDYSHEIANGVELGLHIGYHDGDFVDQFNFANGTFDYMDYNVSISKGGFSFLVSNTDLDDREGGAIGLQNDSVKYVISYSLDVDL